jgi:adenine-specific DNA glycosylase
MALIAPEDWLFFSHALIYHGRAICQARKPLCEQCVLLSLCPTGQVNVAAGARNAASAPAKARAVRARAPGK